MSITFTDIPTRHVDFSSLLEDHQKGDIYSNALRNLDVSVIPEKWHGMGEDVAEITADTTEKLEEKMQDFSMFPLKFILMLHICMLTDFPSLL